MLDCTREEVLGFLAAKKLDYLTDETNFDVEGQSRARIRHRLLPGLARTVDPNIKGALVRLAEGARAAQSALEALADERLERAEFGADQARLPCGELDCPHRQACEEHQRARERAHAAAHGIDLPAPEEPSQP